MTAAPSPSQPDIPEWVYFVAFYGNLIFWPINIIIGLLS